MKKPIETRLFVAAGLAWALIGGAAHAAMVTANCTGMLNVDIYTIDTDLASQVVAGIGEAEVTLTDGAILLDGAFGQYKFDLKLGTLYHDDKDTGLYCTYSGLPQG